jgi:hypothetical protein
MILEVNNTFDEKRMYLLKTLKEENPPPAYDEEMINNFTAPILSRRDASLQNENIAEKPSQNGRIQPSSAEFHTTWAKDFHVSPFNSRTGNYTLSAHDPFAPFMSGNGAIRNTITLSSSPNHATLVARVFSTGSSVDPSSLRMMDAIRLVTGWWWVGLVTFPRILREAGKLFFRRKLHVWYRPEVLPGSIGRRETRDEQ